jgi:hypothetical protein
LGKKKKKKERWGAISWWGCRQTFFFDSVTAGRQFTRNWQSHYNSINSSTLPRKAAVICYFALRFFLFAPGSYFHDNFRPVASSSAERCILPGSHGFLAGRRLLLFLFSFFGT